MAQPTDDKQAPLYSDGVGYDNEYTIEPGVCVLPLAAEPPTSLGQLETWSPVVVLRLHAPYRLRQFRYQARKQNAPPILPTPADTGKFVFVGGSLQFATPAQNMSQTLFDWSVSAEYTFIGYCVSRTQDGFVLGTPPYKTLPQAENLTALGGAPMVASPGAIAQAGPDARVGFVQGNTILGSFGLWMYNSQSFFPGTFFNDVLANAGPGPGGI